MKTDIRKSKGTSYFIRSSASLSVTLNTLPTITIANVTLPEGDRSIAAFDFTVRLSKATSLAVSDRKIKGDIVLYP